MLSATNYAQNYAGQHNRESPPRVLLFFVLPFILLALSKGRGRAGNKATVVMVT